MTRRAHDGAICQLVEIVDGIVMYTRCGEKMPGESLHACFLEEWESKLEVTNA